MLRCSCSFITGSWVTKPGDRHARPTSWIPRPPSPRAVNGPRAVPGPPPVLLFFERSSFLGLWRAVSRLGELGSFFTMIFGGPPAFLAALGGEDLCALVAPTPRGLPLPEREVGAFGVPDT